MPADRVLAHRRESWRPTVYDTGTASSMAEAVAALTDEERARFLGSLTREETAALRYTWAFWARPDQRRPKGKWGTWAIQAGRGAGKTRSGAEFVIEDIARLKATGLRDIRYALVANTPADAREVMIDGESGIVACSPPWNRPVHHPSLRRLEWPDGTVAFTYSAEQPNQLRGPQHHGGWIDEFSKMRRPQETLDNFLFGLRLGSDPKSIATFTPRNIKAVRDLLADPDTVTTGGSTLLNRANLPARVIERLIRKYGGTKLGRQELGGELITDTSGALWTLTQLDQLRVTVPPVTLTRIVVAIDPAGSSKETTDQIERTDETGELPETGIVAAGVGTDGHLYVLEDASGSYDPGTWSSIAIGLFRKYEADAIIGEINFGGEMVEHTIRTAARDVGMTIPVTVVRASRGKLVRAEPVSLLYEQGRAHHVETWPDLEDQMSTWVPGRKSPDRLDALVWAAYALVISQPDALIYH